MRSWRCTNTCIYVEPLLALCTLCFLRTGNIRISPLSRHCQRCTRIFNWSKKNSSGFSPKASAVANAIAYSPQSYVPD